MKKCRFWGHPTFDVWCLVMLVSLKRDVYLFYCGIGSGLGSPFGNVIQLFESFQFWGLFKNVCKNVIYSWIDIVILKFNLQISEIWITRVQLNMNIGCQVWKTNVSRTKQWCRSLYFSLVFFLQYSVFYLVIFIIHCMNEQ